MPIDESGARLCGCCDRSANFRHMRQCSNCGKGQPPEYYCITCREPGCLTLECQAHETCWERHLPTDPLMRRKHSPIDPLAEIYVSAVTYSEADEDEQKKNHQRDKRNQWFLVHYSGEQWDDPQPWLAVTDRFRQLCDPQQVGNRFGAAQYPSFVSFIGDTGVGKSTLLRSQLLMSQVNASNHVAEDENETFQKLLAAKEQGPVTRSASTDALTDPTSSGVHLYQDVVPPCGDAAGPLSPILFADCEGFRGSISQTNSERAFVNGAVGSAANSQHQTQEHDNGMPRRRQVPGSEYAILNKQITAAGLRRQQGKEGAEIFYARMLYALSDCLVFVTKSDQMLHSDLQRLMEWAASAVHNSVNQAVHKTLIVVRNMPELHNTKFYNSAELDKSLFKSLRPLWEGSAILRDFKQKHDAMFMYESQKIHNNKDLFDIFFKSHQAVYIPSNSKAPVEDIYTQYQALRRQIDRACEISQEGRHRSWTQYNVPTLTHLLNRAFEHYRTSDRPFDFFTAARKDNPDLNSPADHIANFLSRTWKYRESRFPLFTAAVSVSLVNYVLRNYEGLPRDARTYFDQELKDFCRQSLSQFGDKYQSCGFRFDNLDNANCVVRRPVHVEHCNRDGVRRPGEFVDEMNKIRDSIMDSIWTCFSDIFQKVCIKDKPLPSPRQASQRREEVFAQFSELWQHIKSNKTCFACLYHVPDYVLPYGHALCGDCIVEFGQPSDWLEACYSLSRCPLCQLGWPYQPPSFRLKPKCAGVRVLTLDGGGIRGIVELAILEQVMATLDKSFGVNVPIRELFDLIMGTSTGGIIALGLALLGDIKVETMKAEFTDLAKETFKARRAGWVVTQFDPLQLVPKMLMILKLKESVYRTRPLKKGLQELFGEQRRLFSNGPSFQEPRITRVAVTSAKDDAATACLITNYNRPQVSVKPGCSGFGWRSDLERWNGDFNNTDFEREDREEKEFKVWEAGLATAAAPFYFKSFNKTETDRSYVDGAVYANLPIESALLEIPRIWPELGNAPPDVLVSVGTGRQLAELKFPDVLDIGGLKKLCKVFHQSLDTRRLWQEFRYAHRRNARLMERIHRLNVDVDISYVALDKWDRMGNLADMVANQMSSAASPLASLVGGVADVLVANLFFFEPASYSHDGVHAIEQRQAEPHPIYCLRGSVRCRLARASGALKRLLEHVAGFAHKELTADERPDDRRRDGWSQVPLPEGVRTAVHAHNDWLRIPVHLLAHEEEPARQVLALQLRGREDEEPIPISGFPVTLSELQVRAAIARS